MPEDQWTQAYGGLVAFAVIIVLAFSTAWFVIRTYSQNVSREATFVRIFAFNIGVAGVGIGAAGYLDNLFPTIFVIIITGMLTFFGFVSRNVHGKPDARIEDPDIRIAIAASLTMMYMVIAGYGIWVTRLESPSPIAQTLLTSLSTLVGTVIAFYFGTSAYLEGKGKAAEPHAPEPKPDRQD